MAGLFRDALDLIDLLNSQIAEVDEQIGELVKPLQPQLDQFDTTPGVNATAVWLIIAEIVIEKPYRTRQVGREETP